MRIEQLTFTRFIAAFSIVIFHFGSDIIPFNSSFVSFIFVRANAFVSYFFVLSGFIMIIAYGSKKTIIISNFFKNRFARIYPIYLLALMLLLIYDVKYNSPINYSDLILNLFAIQAWIPGKAVSFNPPGWALSIEIFFYLVFPFLYNFIYNRISIKALILPVLLVWMISQVISQWLFSSSFYSGYPSNSHDFIFYFPLMHINELLIGNIAGLWFVHTCKGKYKNYDWLILGLILLFVATVKVIALKNPFGLNLHNGVLAIFFVPFIILVSMNNGVITKIFNKKPLVFLGEISYGVYILQFPAYLCSQHIFGLLHIENKIVRFYLFVILLLSMASISYLFIESPVRQFFKRRFLPVPFNGSR